MAVCFDEFQIKCTRQFCYIAQAHELITVMTNIEPFQTFNNVCKDYRNLEVEITTKVTNKPSKVKCRYLRIYDDIHKSTWDWKYDAELVVESPETTKFRQLQPQKNDRLIHETLGTWEVLEIGTLPIPSPPDFTVKLRKI